MLGDEQMVSCKWDTFKEANINVSFSNNSNVAIDLLIFTFYSDKLVIDVETGVVNE